MVGARPARKLDRSVLFSLAVPVYDEEATLDALFKRITAVADKLPVSVEVILVNDGSSDNSLAIMRDFVARDARFRVVDLSRNFGHQYAVSAALSVARGDVVGIIDADLQDPPEILGDMLARWAEGVDVVYGQRRSRAGESRFKVLSAKLFYRLLSRIANVEIPRDAGDFRVLDRRVVETVNAMPERRRFLRGMYAWAGFRQEAYAYRRDPRIAGATKYPLKRMVALSIDGVVSFSMTPLRWLLYFGLGTTALAFASAVYLLALRIFDPEALAPGIAGLFIAMLFMFGINFICLGIIGEYLGRCYVDVQGRPLYIIRDIYEAEEPASSASTGAPEISLEQGQ